MKGILKGLRYISQIFENDYEEEEEEEMQIGCPTDVLHVAHIGVEGPAVANPSWMNGKKSESSEKAKKKGEANTKSKDKNASQDLSQAATDLPQSTQDMPEVSKPSRTRRHSNSVMLNSTDSQELEVPKKSSRRGHSLDLTETKKSSTTKKGKDYSISSSNEVLDTPSIPKSSRKKKLKESPSTVGVVASSRVRRKGSKDSNSLSTASNVQVPVSAPEPANKNNSSELSQQQEDDLDDLKLEEKGF
ncbi:hypothetical protein MKX01_019693 [Papaver californicum]|nr:hypothetical protein MKX01_019693 [Papaver californicum]